MARRERPLTTALGWRLPDWLLDFGPVAVVGLFGLFALRVSAHQSGAPRALLGAGLIVAVSALLLRHRAPLAVLGIVLGLLLGFGWEPILILPVLLGIFNVAEYSNRSRLALAFTIAIAVLIVNALLRKPQLSVAGVTSQVVMLGLAVALGLYLRTRADYIGGLRERAERLERERELLAQQAVAEERVRIARELHDVVAHNVSLMVVQAQAVAATGGDAHGREALHHVADLGRDALSEMHRMLGVLRLQSSTSAEREPQPGVHEVPALIERARTAGLDVRLVVDGEPRALPAGVDLSAYRIAQEALTNVIRHAHAEHATVKLGYRPQALEVTVLDDGIASTGATDRPGGHGLIGMRERVALFGGELEAGPRTDGHGYRVRALIPIR